MTVDCLYVATSIICTWFLFVGWSIYFLSFFEYSKSQRHTKEGGLSTPLEKLWGGDTPYTSKYLPWQVSTPPNTSQGVNKDWSIPMAKFSARHCKLWQSHLLKKSIQIISKSRWSLTIRIFTKNLRHLSLIAAEKNKTVEKLHKM